MDRVTDDPEISQQNMAAVHKTIKKVTNDIDELKMNTAIAALMALVNDFYAKGLSKGDLEALLKLLSPFAPPYGGGDVGAHGLRCQIRQDVYADALA